MLAYKVVVKDEKTGCLISVTLSPDSPWCVEYHLNHVTKAPLGGGPLFCFKTEDDVRSFYDYEFRNKKLFGIFELYKCEIEPANRCPLGCEKISSNLGIVFAESVKLLEEIKI